MAAKSSRRDARSVLERGHRHRCGRRHVLRLRDLNSPSYRERYRDALRYDFARLPFTADAELFATVRDLGRELALAHLLEHPSRDSELPAMEGDDEAVLEAPRYEPETKTLYLAETLLARPIEGEEWHYQQGAYRVLRDYVEARRDRNLSSEEFTQFRELAAAVRLTLRLLPKIDAVMPAVIANTFAANALGFPDDNGAPDR